MHKAATTLSSTTRILPPAPPVAAAERGAAGLAPDAPLLLECRLLAGCAASPAAAAVSAPAAPLLAAASPPYRLECPLNCLSTASQLAASICRLCAVVCRAPSDHCGRLLRDPGRGDVLVWRSPGAGGGAASGALQLHGPAAGAAAAADGRGVCPAAPPPGAGQHALPHRWVGCRGGERGGGGLLPASLPSLFPCGLWLNTAADAATPAPPPPCPAGFSLAGGALWASLCFVAAFALYIVTVLPVEERMLREAFGDKHERYV